MERRRGGKAAQNKHGGRGVKGTGKGRGRGQQKRKTHGGRKQQRRSECDVNAEPKAQGAVCVHVARRSR